MEPKDLLNLRKKKAADCTFCCFYDDCFIDGQGTPVAGECEPGYVWKY